MYENIIYFSIDGIFLINFIFVILKSVLLYFWCRNPALKPYKGLRTLKARYERLKKIECMLKKFI